MRLKRLIQLAVVPLVLIAGLINPASAQANLNLKEGNDPAAILFDPLTVNSISLRMSSSDFESLKYPNVSWDNEGDWRRTTMNITVAGKAYGPYTVGVHLKGAWGSWRDVNGKAAFKVKMNAFVKGQTLFGVTKLTLNNMVQDPSYIHEFMTYRLMRSVGLPAPRTGYANVFLNGINYGLHLNVETVDKHMLARWGIGSERIYKGSLPNFPDMYPGNEWAFTLEAGTEANRQDLSYFLNINSLSGEEWWEEISQATDMELLTRQWAVELYSGHWDGYLLNRNNYFVNFDENGQALMLSWGVDQTWGGAPDYFSYPTLLPNKCMSSTSCTEMYYQSLAKVAATVQNLNLAYSASAVANAIVKAIGADPWGSIAGANSAQQGAIDIENYRKYELNQLVIPWDTTIKMVQVNALKFEPRDLIYLSPGTRNVTVSLSPRQITARSVPVYKSLVPGSNEVTVQVLSADGKHSKSYTFEFYVLSQRTSKVAVKFASGSATPSSAGNSYYQALLNKLTDAKNIELTVTSPASISKSLTSKRLASIKAALSKKSISYKLMTATGGTTSNQLILTAKYQN